VWAMKGGSEVPKQGGVRIIVLILIQRPRTKRISCKGQFSTAAEATGARPAYTDGTWRLHDIPMATIVWCMAIQVAR